jgi:hypothetical protein
VSGQLLVSVTVNVTVSPTFGLELLTDFRDREIGPLRLQADGSSVVARRLRDASRIAQSCQ